MKLRWFVLLAVVLLLALGAAIYQTLTSIPVMTPQTVVLSNGNSFEFTDITYGTNHVVGSPMAQMVSRLPKILQQIVSPLSSGIGTISTRTTPRPTLLIWYRGTQGTKVWFPRVFVADERGVSSGSEQTLFTFVGGTGLSAVEFEQFPRRSKTLQLHIPPEGADNAGSAWVVTNIPNPAYATFPQWTPETLPSTKKVGDLEVTLSEFGTGFGNSSATTHSSGGKATTTFSKRKPNAQNFSIFEVAFREKGKTNASWTVAQEVLSDATGNEGANSIMGDAGDGIHYVAPSLWLDEAAWKLKLILKRKVGFAPNELFTFKEVPIGILNKTNLLAISTNTHGATIKLEHFFLSPGSTTNKNSWSISDFSELRLTTRDIPPGFYLDLAEARTGTNRLEVPGWGRGSNEQTYRFGNIPEGTKTIDLTFALHPSRTVEFLVKPGVENPKFLSTEED